MRSSSLGVLVLAAAASACGDDSASDDGSDAPYLCQLEVCPDGDAHVQTCPQGATCYEVEDCETKVLCAEGGCEGVDFGATTCDLAGSRCVVQAGDCKSILLCEEAEGTLGWVDDGSGPCSEG